MGKLSIGRATSEYPVPLGLLDINYGHENIKLVQVRSAYNISFLREAMSQ